MHRNTIDFKPQLLLKFRHLQNILEINAGVEPHDLGRVGGGPPLLAVVGLQGDAAQVADVATSTSCTAHINILADSSGCDHKQNCGSGGINTTHFNSGKEPPID